MRIEVLIDVKAVLGEGPLWDVDEQRLYFIDSFGCNVFRCTAGGGEVRAWDVPAKIGSMALRRRGGAVLSLADGFHFLDFKTGECQLIVDPEPDKPDNRINDGKVDKRGRFVAGSMDTMEEGPNGALYRLDPELSLHKLDDRIIVSNGPCWSPDGRTFYFADSWSGEIWAYDYDLDTGAVSNKRTFCKIDRSRGGAATAPRSTRRDVTSLGKEARIRPTASHFVCYLKRLIPGGGRSPDKPVCVRANSR